MFQGFADADGDIVLTFVTRDGDGLPVDPDAGPTYRLFGPAGAVGSGTGTATSLESGSLNAATNASPIAVTATAAHGLPTGAYVKVAGVAGNTAANGTFFITQTGSTTFTLTGSTGNGAYTSGGTWKSVGLWKVTLTGGVLASLEPGKTYTLLLTWTESAAARQLPLTFTVQ